MKRGTYLMLAGVFLLPLFGLSAESILGVDTSQTELTVVPGGTGTGELMLVNCGTNTLNFSLEPRGIEVQGYTPGSCALEPSWIDLSTNLNAVEVTFDDSTDAVSAPVDLRFVFPFYEEVFTNVTIGKNGLIALGAADSIGSNYAPFPTTNAPPYSIAPYWGDLSYVTNSELPSRGFYLSDSNRLVVMYQDMRNNNYGGAVQNFEAILSENGAVTFRYDGVAGLDSVSRGIQDYTNGVAENLWSSTGGSSLQLTPQYPDYYTINNATVRLDAWFFDPNTFAPIYEVGATNLDQQVYSFDSTFPFFGKMFTKYRIHRNGYISLATSAAFEEGESCIIAPFKTSSQYDANAIVCRKVSGNSIIVTWMNMRSSDDCYRTLLYSDGKIVFEYYSIASVYSVWGGVQSYGTSYVHPSSLMTNFVISQYENQVYLWPQVTYTPNVHRTWLSASPKTGIISNDCFQKVTLTGDSTGLDTNRTYSGNVLVTHSATNSASSALVKCPVTMETPSAGPLICVMDVRYDPIDCYRIDRIGPGDTAALYVTLKNDGAVAVSNLIAVLSTNSYIYLTGTNAQTYGDLPAGETAVNSQPYIVNVKTNCSAGVTNLVLQINSNGSVIQTNPVSVRVEPTFMLAIPDILAVNVRSGYSTNVSMVLSNGGNASLDYIFTDVGEFTGYNWVSTNFQWQNIFISTDDPMSWIGGTDEGYSQLIPVNFPFPFYGNVYTQLCIGVNGGLLLGEAGSMTVGSTLSNAPDHFITPYRGDLALDTDAQIGYSSDANRLIVTWKDMRQSGGGSNQTFQAILNRDGSICFQYLTLAGSNAWPYTAIGLRDVSNRYVSATLSNAMTTAWTPIYTTNVTTNGYGNLVTEITTNIVFSYNNVVTSEAISFTPVSRILISASSLTGTILPGEACTIPVSCNATNFAPGAYALDLPISYSGGSVSIPVLLNVTE